MNFFMNNKAIHFDQKAKTLAKDYLHTEGQLLLVLMDMKKEKVFASLNYSGIFEYCEKALKLSRAQAYYFKSVAEKAVDIPEIKDAVVQGELTLSQARRIAPVLTQENKEAWFEKAKLLPQKELEKEVTAVNPKAHPREKIKPVAKELSELKVTIDTKTEENLKVLKDILSQKKGKSVSLAEVIAWATEVTREKHDPIKKAERARPISLRKSPAQPGRKPVPVSLKHEVVKRDGTQCTFVSPDGRRCGQTRWLQHHHVQEVQNGGLNTLENLRTLCSAHHRFIHHSPSRLENRGEVFSKLGDFAVIGLALS